MSNHTTRSRRTALAIAATLTATAAAAGVAGAVNLGLLSGDTPATTTFTPTATFTQPEGLPGSDPNAPQIIYQDVYDLPPVSGSTGAVGSAPAPASTLPASDDSSVTPHEFDDDHEFDHDEFDDHDELDDHDETDEPDDDEFEVDDDHSGSGHGESHERGDDDDD